MILPLYVRMPHNLFHGGNAERKKIHVEQYFIDFQLKRHIFSVE